MKIEIGETMVLFLLFISVLVASALMTSDSEKIGEVLETAVAKMRADFHSQNLSGQYDIKISVWQLFSGDKSVNYVPAGTNMTVPNNAILINNRFPTNARGAVFLVAERKDKTVMPFVSAAVIVAGNNKLTEWQPFNESKFSMSFYDRTNTKKRLECCSIYDSQQKESYSVYYLKCGIIWGS